MRWKNWPYWLKGGLILVGIDILYWLWKWIIILLTSPPSALTGEGSLIGIYIVILTIVTIIPAFIIGAIIGLIVGKIKSKK